MIGSILSNVPVIDLLAAFGWLAIIWRLWRGVLPPSGEAPLEERTLGATVIMGQLSAVITACSIIIAGIAAFVALKSTSIDPPSNYHLFYATLWSVVALGGAVYCMGTLPPRTLRINFVQDREIAMFCSMTLLFTLAAGIRFLFAVATMLLCPTA